MKETINRNQRIFLQQLGNISNHPKILIEALHGLGDVVCMIPMFMEIRGQYPKAEITILVNQAIKVDIITCSNIQVEFCIVLNIHNNIIKTLRECGSLRRKKFDIAISSANTPVLKSKIFMWFINPINKYGIQFKYGKNFDDLNDYKHFVEANLMAIEDLIDYQHDYNPCLIADKGLLEALKRDMDVKESDIVIGICIGRADVSFKNKLFRKQPVYTRGWGDYVTHVHNMEKLADKILCQGWKIILIGGKKEKSIKNLMSPQIINNINVKDMVGKTTLAQSIALASICDVMVGVDTGMQHIADAVGTRSVSIFGPTNPKTHGAYSNRAIFAEVEEQCRCCYGTSNYVKCKDRKCMYKINSDYVFKLIYNSIQLLNKNVGDREGDFYEHFK